MLRALYLGHSGHDNAKSNPFTYNTAVLSCEFITVAFIFQWSEWIKLKYAFEPDIKYGK